MTKDIYLVKKILKEFLSQEPEKASELIEFIRDVTSTSNYNVSRERIIQYFNGNVLSKAFARKLRDASSPKEMRRVILKYRERMLREGNQKKVELCDWLLNQPFIEIKKVIKEEVLW